MVLKMGFEPTRHKSLVPETSVSTIPPLEHIENNTTKRNNLSIQDKIVEKEKLIR